jgi:hypothetical protein
MADRPATAISHLDELNKIGSLPGSVAEACRTAYRDAHCHLIDFGKLSEPIRGYPELPYNNPAIRAALVTAYAAGRADIQAEAQRARTAVHRYFGHPSEVDACTVGICWTITHPDGPGTKPWQPSADEALDAASQLIGYANQAGGE